MIDPRNPDAVLAFAARPAGQGACCAIHRTIGPCRPCWARWRALVSEANQIDTIGRNIAAGRRGGGV